MTTLLHLLRLGKRIVNADHIIMAEWHDAEPAATRFAYGDQYEVAAQPARVVLTLSSITATQVTENGGASQSEYVSVDSPLAEKLWRYLERRSCIVDQEPMPTTGIQVPQ